MVHRVVADLALVCILSYSQPLWEGHVGQDCGGRNIVLPATCRLVIPVHEMVRFGDLDGECLFAFLDILLQILIRPKGRNDVKFCKIENFERDFCIAIACCDCTLGDIAEIEYWKRFMKSVRDLNVVRIPTSYHVQKRFIEKILGEWWYWDNRRTWITLDN